MKIAYFLLVYLYIYRARATEYNKNWWKSTSFYQIYIPSFKDSNNDGIGDLRGIISKLDYFADIGLEVLYISPHYSSPMKDMGYDVSDYKSVNPLFGTMEDFEELLRKLTEKGIKLVADLVINHSSDKHEWFQKSLNKIEPYTDYYIWRESNKFDYWGQRKEPNNWSSIFGGSSWKYREERRKYYFHHFLAEQPDLNLRNENVKREIKDIMKFWFDKGIAGFRIDAPMFFMEDKLFRNEQVPTVHTMHQWDSYEFIHELRQFVDNYNEKAGGYERLFVAEAYGDINKTMSYYGSKEYPISHFPFNYDFAFLMDYKNASEFHEFVDTYMKNIPEGGIPNWGCENHDVSRTGSRLNDQYIDILLITIMTLPGVALLYYGQEIGMTDSYVRKDLMKDFLGRDPFRLPMQWDDSVNAGFTSNSIPFLPPNPNYYEVNVQKQKTQQFSRYKLFQELMKVRKTESSKSGDFKPYVISEWIYAFTRSCANCKTLIILMNLGSSTEIINLKQRINGISAVSEVVAASLNAGYHPGDEVVSALRPPNLFSMRPFSSIVLRSK